MKPEIHLSLSLTHAHMHTQSNTHSGCPVGGQLLQKWEGSPVNWFHRPATDRKVTGFPRVQHTVSHAHLTAPPTVLRATGHTESQLTIYEYFIKYLQTCIYIFFVIKN